MLIHVNSFAPSKIDSFIIGVQQRGGFRTHQVLLLVNREVKKRERERDNAFNGG